MNQSIQSLMASFNLRRADEIDAGKSVSPASSVAMDADDLFVQIAAGGVHEFFSPDGSACTNTANASKVPLADWDPPLTFLAALAGKMAAGKCVLWVGRRCWPAWYFLHAAGQKVGHDGDGQMVQSFYFDPLSQEQWLDAIVQAARCPAVGLIVASTTAEVSLAVGRRLQLAAEARPACICLARPMRQSTGHCWAAARWHIRPQPSTSGRPQWDIQLAAAKKSARFTNRWTASWNYEVIHGAGYMHISPAVGDRSYAAAGAYVPAQAG
jgi:hypothetical protein